MTEEPSLTPGAFSPTSWSRSPRFRDPTIHDWYLSVMAFPDHVVDTILDHFDPPPNASFADPHCGAGTSLIQAQRRGLKCFGIDANPSSVLASTVKTEWSVDRGQISQKVDELESHAKDHSPLSGAAALELQDDPILYYLRASGMIQRGWIQDDVAADLVALKRWMDVSIADPKIRRFFLLGLMAAVVKDLSNVRFGPELYCVPAKRPSPKVGPTVVARIRSMMRDLEASFPEGCQTPARVRLGDSRDGRTIGRIGWGAKPCYVVTSPPYPAEHDYTRNARLELVFTEAVDSLASLRAIKKKMLRSHSKGIYIGDRDADLVRDVPSVTRIQLQILHNAGQRRRGFIGQYPKVIGNYFGGMLRHLRAMARYLPRESKLAYVVGDQASYLGVYVPTAEILTEIINAKEPGLDVTEVIRWRQRRSTSTSTRLWEHVMFMSVNGKSREQ